MIVETERDAALSAVLYGWPAGLRRAWVLAMHWVSRGQALAHLRGRHDDAVLALRRAELISPRRVLRNPSARDVLAVLLRHSRRSSPADEELRGMARGAGLIE